jgi:xanthine/uracil permease
MENYPNFIDFMRRYFPTFIATIFVAKIAFLLALFALLDSFFAGVPLASQGKLSAIGIAICTMVLVHSNFMVIRGRTGWIWLFVGLFVACLLCVLPTISYRPNRIVYAAGLFFPLLGLLLINSKRHREMRSKLVEIRHQRERIIQSAKASRPRR